MALPPRLNKFRDLHALTTGIDATSGDKVLAAPADVSVGKILIVLATHYNADAAQDFELKATIHLVDENGTADELTFR